MEPKTDFIATELLQELKASNTRKDAQISQLHKYILIIVLGAISAILLIVAGMLWYLNQYDFVSTDEYTFTASGVYALVDSEGNVLAQDLTSEDMKQIMEVLNTNGDGESNGHEEALEG